MEKPGKKLKKFFIITGITGMVYAGLKYLLPLVVPLLLGYTLALLLRPSARFLQHRITVRIFGKKWKPSLGLIVSVQLLILAVLGSFLLTLGIRRLWEETSTLMNQLPVWLGFISGSRKNVPVLRSGSALIPAGESMWQEV